MLDHIAQFFKRTLSDPALRRKIIVTLVIVTVFRIATYIPATGIDKDNLEILFQNSPLLSLLDFFSGGTLANFSIMALGLNPYINASIIMQLLGYVVPQIEELQKEGEYGQERINQYTRFLTVPIAIVQSFGMYSLLRSQSIIPNLGPLDLILLCLAMTAGTMVAVWLGDLITEYAFKNGISLLIFVGIISRLPVLLSQTLVTFRQEDLLKIGIILVLTLIIMALIIFVNESVRQIPISYAKIAKSLRQSQSYLPLRLNQAGVIPIIFAVSLVLMPSMVLQFLGSSNNEVIQKLILFTQIQFSPTSILYNTVYFLLVVGFTFFYTQVVFNPEKIAENLQKSGGFITGIRPGSATIAYLKYILNRITIFGAIFLATIAVMPSVFQNFIGVANLAIGGTGLLIAISVVLEIIREIDGEIMMTRYSSYQKI